MDFILAHSRYKRRKFDEAIQICDQMLSKNSKDEAAWVLKCQCLIKDNYIDELQMEEDNLAEMMMQDNEKNNLARAGTSFKASSSHNHVMRPMTNGRINTGFQRVGTSLGSRAGSKANNTKMLRTGRIMTKAGIPTTSNGRVLRLSTASLEQHGQDFFDVSKTDLRRISQSRSKSRLIFLYLFYVEHNMKKALQLAIYSTQINNYNDPWWKLCLGKCYYQLAFLPEAQKQLHSAMNGTSNSTIILTSALYLSRVYYKQDNVQKCLKILSQQTKPSNNPFEPKVFVYLGRLYDELQQFQKSYEMYQSALTLENCHIQALANIASYYYFKDQSQISLKLYRRLIELGYDQSQIWNNIGICAYTNNCYQQFYYCFQRALKLAQDSGDNQLYTDLWYNIGNVYANMGEIQMAKQAYQSSLGYFPQNQLALNNIGVINWQQGNKDIAINYAQKSFRATSNFQAAYNLSLWYYYGYQYQRSYHYNKQALNIYPEHAESQQVLRWLKRKLQIL